MLTLKQNEETETLRQKKKEEREKEQQAGDMQVNEVQVQLDKMKAETKVTPTQMERRSVARSRCHRAHAAGVLWRVAGDACQDQAGVESDDTNDQRRRRARGDKAEPE